MAKVSVIIPSYNRGDMIAGAIQSVLDQVYRDWEIIVVDDGSQDHTRQVVARFQDERIRYLYQENKKLPGARNTGVRNSCGEYLAFLDSDDYFLPDKLGQQVFALDCDSGIGLVASGWTEVDAQRKPLRTRRPWRLNAGLELNDWLYTCPITPASVLVRRGWLNAVGLFDERQHYVEDWDLWLRLSYAGCQMAWVPGIVCLRTIHGGNMVHNAEQMSAGLFRLMDKFYAQANLPAAIIDQRDQVYANAHLNAAVRAFGVGSPQAGQEHLVAAVHLNSKLLEGQPPTVLHTLASSAITHQVLDQQRYVEHVCASLPQVSPRLTISRRQMWALIRATASFEDIANGHRQRARLKAVLTLLTDPTWLRNRGLLSILLNPGKHTGSAT